MAFVNFLSEAGLLRKVAKGGGYNIVWIYFLDDDIQNSVLLKKQMKGNDYYSNFSIIKGRSFYINDEMSDFLEIETDIKIEAVKIV